MNSFIFFYTKSSFLFILLSIVALCSFGQLNTAIAPQNAQLSWTAPDSLSGQDFHYAIHFDLPDSVSISAVHLTVYQQSPTMPDISLRIPLHSIHHVHQGVGCMITGQEVWLDVGVLPGAASYQATLQLEDDAGTLSSIVQL